jgi:hypothetical protein
MLVRESSLIGRTFARNVHGLKFEPLNYLAKN